MANTIRMNTYDAAEGTGMFRILDHEFYVNCNTGIVTLVDLKLKRNIEILNEHFDNK
jgi:hypothetical protein